MSDISTCKSSLDILIAQKLGFVAVLTHMLSCNSEVNEQNTDMQNICTMILKSESTSYTHLQNSGSQESLGNGIAKEQEDAQPRDKQASKEEVAGTSNAGNSVSASGNHTPIRSSFEDVPGLAIR